MFAVILGVQPRDRDSGMFDRREVPQYYADVPGADTLHS